MPFYSIKSSAKCGDMKKDEGKSDIATFVVVWAKIRVNQEAGGRVRGWDREIETGTVGWFSQQEHIFRGEVVVYSGLSSTERVTRRQ